MFRQAKVNLDQEEGWTLASTLFGVTTHYRREENGTLSMKIEGKMEGLPLFDQVAVKPGKPTTFGVLSNKSFFLGLPGNPVSCFTSLIFFFSKFINSFYGQEFISLKSNQLSLKNQISKNNHLTNFLRIKIEKNKPNFFRVFSKQDSE